MKINSPVTLILLTTKRGTVRRNIGEHLFRARRNSLTLSSIHILELTLLKTSLHTIKFYFSQRTLFYTAN